MQNLVMLNVFSTSQPFKSNLEYGMMDLAVFLSEKQNSRTDICVYLYGAIFCRVILNGSEKEYLY